MDDAGTTTRQDHLTRTGSRETGLHRPSETALALVVTPASERCSTGWRALPPLNENTFQEHRPRLASISSDEPGKISQYAYVSTAEQSGGRTHCQTLCRKQHHMSAPHLRDVPRLPRRSCGTGKRAQRCCRRPSAGTS